MILVMGVGLYTSRVILKALGADDFGLYSVVGGLVALFTVVTGSLSAAISRFLTYGLGKGDAKKLKNIFSVALLIQLILIGIILIFLVPIAVWFIADKMNIEQKMLMPAYCVLAFSVATFCVNLLSVPYNAAIISHEKMSVFSAVSIIEVSIKLAISFLIMIFNEHRLIIYAALLFFASLIIQLCYMWYCTRHFDECKTRLKYDKSLLKEIGGYAGWDFIGNSSFVLRNQGLNVLLNLFFGTVVNAAYGICMQVNNAVTQLANNFMTSVNPQIIKYYAQGEKDQCIDLMFRSSRMSFFLTWIVTSFILINTSYIINLWLVDVPTDTVIFVKLILVMGLIESVSSPLITVMQATGKIRNNQLVVGGLRIINLPVAYLVLKLGSPAYYVLLVSITFSILCLIARVIMLNRLIAFNKRGFIVNVILRDIVVVILSLSLPLFLTYTYHSAYNFIQLLWQSIICLISVIITVYFVGCTIGERMFILQKIKNKLKIS